MPPEEWRALGEVITTWGFWFIVYGAITMILGLSILVICNKAIAKF